MVTSLVRREEAFTDEELVDWLRKRVGDGLLEVVDEFDTLTVVLTNEAYAESAELLRSEPRLAFTMFDSLFGVDAGEDGFDVVAILYSVETGSRVLLRTRAAGGREEPTCPTLTGVFAGADFHERETWDMFGIVFEGHAGLAPRILTDEHFEGWPLRKDFHLATREAKPWPGIKEPAETDEDGNVIEKVPGIGEAVGPMPLDEVMAEQARAANPELVAAQEAAEAEPADPLKAEAESVEATALAGGSGTPSTEDAIATAAEEVPDAALDADREDVRTDVRDADEVRAEAAQARAEKAAELAEDGPVSGTGEGDDVPQGDPSAFDVEDDADEAEDES